MKNAVCLFGLKTKSYWLFPQKASLWIFDMVQGMPSDLGS